MVVNTLNNGTYDNNGSAYAISSYTTSYTSLDGFGISCTKSGGNWSSSQPISMINISVAASTANPTSVSNLCFRLP